MGYFITFEGPEGSGKTTICQKVYEQLLLEYPNQVVLTREPGGKNNKIAEQIRQIILNNDNINLDYRTEALLFAASRAQHVSDFIIPNLSKNKIVLCDRYIHSSLVYQGYARELGVDNVFKINEFAIKNTMPDLCILIMVKPEIGLKRIKEHNRDVNRIDEESLQLHKKVYEGYRLLAKKYPNIVKVVDGSGTISQTFNNVMELIHKHIKGK